MFSSIVELGLAPSMVLMFAARYNVDTWVIARPCNSEIQRPRDWKLSAAAGSVGDGEGEMLRRRDEWRWNG
jgi:hypothetical protein